MNYSAARGTGDTIVVADHAWLALLRACEGANTAPYLERTLAGPSEALNAAAADWGALVRELLGVGTGGWVPAAFARLGETPALELSSTRPALWRADPVHLVAGLDHVRMAAAFEALALQADEANALLASLNAHFAADGLSFRRGGEEPEGWTRWYLEMPDEMEVTAVSTRDALGRDLRGAMPRGPAAPAIAGLVTECQMLLAGHPVNVSREAAGLPAVNSLWIWGGQPHAAHEHGSWSAAPALPTLASTEPELRGAWRAAGAARLTPPALPAGGDPAIAYRRWCEEVLDESVWLTVERRAIDLAAGAQDNVLWLDSLLRRVRRAAPRGARLVLGARAWALPRPSRLPAWWPRPAAGRRSLADVLLASERG